MKKITFLLFLSTLFMAMTCHDDEFEYCTMNFQNDTNEDVYVVCLRQQVTDSEETTGIVKPLHLCEAAIAAHEQTTINVCYGSETWKYILSNITHEKITAVYTLVFASKADYYRWLADIEGQELTEELINDSEYVQHVYKFTKDNVPDERTLTVRYQQQ